MKIINKSKWIYFAILLILFCCTDVKEREIEKQQISIRSGYYLFQVPEWGVEFQLYHNFLYHKRGVTRRLKLHKHDINTVKDLREIERATELDDIQYFDFFLDEYIFSSFVIEDGWAVIDKESIYRFSNKATIIFKKNSPDYDSTHINHHSNNLTLPSPPKEMDFHSKLNFLGDTVEYYEEVTKYYLDDDDNHYLYKSFIANKNKSMYVKYFVITDQSQVSEHRERCMVMIESIQEYKYTTTNR